MKTELLKSEMDKLSTELEALTASFREKTQALFSQIIEQFFIETPRVKAIVWNQYTPGFNDGDPCTFTIGEVVFLSQEYDEDIEDISGAYDLEGHEHAIDYTANEDNYNNYTRLADSYKGSTNAQHWIDLASKTRAAIDSDDGTISRCKMISDVINREDSLMEAIFGDNVTVFAIKGKTWTAEYECGY